MWWDCFSAAKPEGMEMLKLILMRHAKSDWSQGNQPDHQRPLNSRGIRDAKRMGTWLKENDLTPDIILCSNACRTEQTAELMLEQWESKPALCLTQELYLASPESIQRTVHQDACDFGCVMVLAHNPGISYLISLLAGEDMQLPTAGLAVFELSIEVWSELRNSSPVRLISLTKPKAL